MKTKRIVGMLLAGAALLHPAVASADGATKPRFGYFLTKAHLVAQLRRTIVACRDAADDQPSPKIGSEWEFAATPDSALAAA